jgi:hypothetical protein
VTPKKVVRGHREYPVLDALNLKVLAGELVCFWKAVARSVNCAGLAHELIVAAQIVEFRHLAKQVQK